MKNIKRKIIRKISQKYRDHLMKELDKTLDKIDPKIRSMPISTYSDGYTNDLNENVIISDEDNSFEFDNDSNPNEKKEKIYQVVLNYAREIGKDCSDWKLWKYDNYPSDKKELLYKIDANFNYDDFVCIFSIADVLNLQLDPKGDYGIIFTLSGFYIHNPVHMKYFIKYSEITKCLTPNKQDIKIYLNHTVSSWLCDDNYVDNSEFSSEALSNLIMELKTIDSEYPSDHLTAITSHRTFGIKSARDRKFYMKGEIKGYLRCSREYEEKLRRQAELFLKVANKWRQERAAYEALLDEYDATIVELEAKLREAESPEYRERLNNVSEYREKLASLSY